MNFKNFISIVLLFLIVNLLIGCTNVVEESDKFTLKNNSFENLDDKATNHINPNEEYHEPIKIVKEIEEYFEDNDHEKIDEVINIIPNKINFNINHSFKTKNENGEIGSKIIHYDNYQDFKKRYPNFEDYNESYFNTKGLIFYSSWEHRPGNHHKIVSLTYFNNILTLNVERRIPGIAITLFLPTNFGCFVEYEKPGIVNEVKLNLVEKNEIQYYNLSDENIELIKEKVELNDYENCTIDMLLIVDQVNQDNVKDYINSLLSLYNIENYKYSLHDNYLYLFFDIKEIEKCLEFSKNVETRYETIVFNYFYQSEDIIS